MQPPLCTRNPFDTGPGPRKHLRKHCREFKPRSGKKGSSKAAGAATDGEDESDDDDDEAAAAAFYAEEDSVGVQGEDVEVKVNEMLLGGASGTITLSESLSRVGSAAVASARAATPAPTSAAPPPPLTPPPPPRAW